MCCLPQQITPVIILLSILNVIMSSFCLVGIHGQGYDVFLPFIKSIIIQYLPTAVSTYHYSPLKTINE